MRRTPRAAVLSDRIDRVISAITLAGAWTVIPALIILMLFHVLGRQVRDVPSEALAELAADLFFNFGQVDRRHVFLLNAFYHEGPHRSLR
jgi:TRAP-type mannitol/chloroaromatic compound transport system permease small subunit